MEVLNIFNFNREKWIIQCNFTCYIYLVRLLENLNYIYCLQDTDFGQHCSGLIKYYHWHTLCNVFVGAGRKIRGLFAIHTFTCLYLSASLQTNCLNGTFCTDSLYMLNKCLGGKNRAKNRFIKKKKGQGLRKPKHLEKKRLLWHSSMSHCQCLLKRAVGS